MANAYLLAFLALVLVATTAHVEAMPVDLIGEQFKVSFDIPNATVVQNDANSTTKLINGSYESTNQIRCMLDYGSGEIGVLYSESTTPDNRSIASTIEKISATDHEAIDISGYNGLSARGIIDNYEFTAAVTKPSNYSVLEIIGLNDTNAFEAAAKSCTIEPVSQFIAPMKYDGRTRVEMGGSQFLLSFDIPNSTIVESSDNNTTELINGSYESRRVLSCVLTTTSGVVDVGYFEETNGNKDIGPEIAAEGFAPGYKEQITNLAGYSGFKISGTRHERNSDVTTVKLSNDALISIIEINDSAALDAATASFKIKPVSA